MPVVIYSGSNRQGIRESQLALFELNNAVKPSGSGQNSLEATDVKRETNYIQRNSHVSSFYTLDALVETLNASSSAIGYECCHYLLPMERVKPIYYDSFLSSLGQDRLKRMKDTGLAIKDLKAELECLRRNTDDLIKTRNSIISTRGPQAISEFIWFRSMMAAITCNQGLKQSVMSKIKKTLLTSQGEFQQPLPALLDRFAPRITYDEALWDKGQSWSENRCPPYDKQQLINGLKDDHPFDDQFFKPLLVYYQMHHLCTDPNNRVAVSLGYNGVAKVLSASDERLAAHIFLEGKGDHPDSTTIHQRYLAAAQCLKDKIQGIAEACATIDSHQEYHFIDDQCARDVYDFFTQHPQLIPEGVRLHCHRYNYYDHVVGKPVEAIFETVGGGISCPSHGLPNAVADSGSSAGPCLFNDASITAECANTDEGLVGSVVASTP